MDTNAIKEVLKQQPFRAFVLRMNDGREWQVAHPEWLMVTEENVVYVDSGNESVVYLEPLLVASLHVSNSKIAKSGENKPK